MVMGKKWGEENRKRKATRAFHNSREPSGHPGILSGLLGTGILLRCREPCDPTGAWLWGLLEFLLNVGQKGPPGPQR